MIKNKIKKVFYYVKRYGIFATIKKIIRSILGLDKIKKESSSLGYKKWIRRNEPTNAQINSQNLEHFDYEPKISIVIPMFNTEEELFVDLYNSICAQSYENWELCLADGSCIKNETIEALCLSNTKVKYKFLLDNEGISGNTNEAIKMATGDYIVFMDHDDLLAKFALYEVVKTINEIENVDFIYSDEDKITVSGERFSPYFKPDYSPEMLECHNYITHLVCVRRDLLERVGLLNSEMDGAQDFDFVLRATEIANNIVHIPKILYHWRTTKYSTASLAGNKSYAYRAGKRAIEEHLIRLGKEGTVEPSIEVPGFYQIKYAIEGDPKVSILIPNKDNIKLLKNCINSILKKTTYPNYEIIIIENNSEKKETFDYYEKIEKNSIIKVIRYPEKGFNYSKLINFGVINCDGDFVLQLNNDTELLTPDWLELFVGYCQNKQIGVVGAKLLYPDKSIQHAGIAIGIKNMAGNLLVNLPYGAHGYYCRETLTSNVSAVTGACLFAQRKIYEEIGYMDEDNFAVAFNDVDFCLRVLEKGYRIVYNPYVELIHYESKTRGYEDTPEKKQRFENEVKSFQIKWSNYLENNDPYYSINFSKENGNFMINNDK